MPHKGKDMRLLSVTDCSPAPGPVQAPISFAICWLPSLHIIRDEKCRLKEPMPHGAGTLPAHDAGARSHRVAAGGRGAGEHTGAQINRSIRAQRQRLVGAEARPGIG